MVMKNIVRFILGIVAVILMIYQCSDGCESASDNEADRQEAVGKVCEECGKRYTLDDKCYDSERGVYVSASGDHCAKCSMEYQRESEKRWWKEQTKKARNKWVDENPYEAKRRGIYKF